MRSRFFPALFLALASNLALANPQISAEIDRDTWSVISQSVADADIDAMASTYHPEAVLVSAEGTRPIAQVLATWGKGMEDAAQAGSRAQVSFRFAQRQDNETTAFERGIFKYVVIDKAGAEAVIYMNFESLLVKKDSRWLYMMERQLDVTDQASWDALPAALSP